MIYDKYPVSKAEIKCRTEKNIMDSLRWKYGKKLYAERKEKREYGNTKP